MPEASSSAPRPRQRSRVGLVLSQYQKLSVYEKRRAADLLLAPGYIITKNLKQLISIPRSIDSFLNLRRSCLCLLMPLSFGRHVTPANSKLCNRCRTARSDILPYPYSSEIYKALRKRFGPRFRPRSDGAGFGAAGTSPTESPNLLPPPDCWSAGSVAVGFGSSAENPSISLLSKSLSIRISIRVSCVPSSGATNVYAIPTAHSASSTYSMNVVVAEFWYIVIDDVRNTGNINTATHDVGCDQNLYLTFTKLPHHTISYILCEIPVDTCNAGLLIFLTPL